MMYKTNGKDTLLYGVSKTVTDCYMTVVGRAVLMNAIVMNIDVNIGFYNDDGLQRVFVLQILQ